MNNQQTKSENLQLEFEPVIFGSDLVEGILVDGLIKTKIPDKKLRYIFLVGIDIDYSSISYRHWRTFVSIRLTEMELIGMYNSFKNDINAYRLLAGKKLYRNIGTCLFEILSIKIKDSINKEYGIASYRMEQTHRFFPMALTRRLSVDDIKPYIKKPNN